MGNFWDTFVFRVCSGLGENLFPQGYNDAAEVLLFADRLGLLDLATLNDLSILLILMTCPAGSSLEGPVAMEYLRRGLGPHRNWACLGEALPPRLTDFHLLAHFGSPRRRAVVDGIVYTLYLPPLVRYLSRAALISYTNARDFAVPFLRRALDRLDYFQIVEDNYLSVLYQLVLRNWYVANGWPAPPNPMPRWARRLSAEKRTFLDCCLDRLVPEDRCLLYLSFYARLNAEQIARVFAPHVPRLTPQGVVDRLVDAWKEVLQCMRHKPTVGRLHNGNGQ